MWMHLRMSKRGRWYQCFKNVFDQRRLFLMRTSQNECGAELAPEHANMKAVYPGLSLKVHKSVFTMLKYLLVLRSLFQFGIRVKKWRHSVRHGGHLEGTLWVRIHARKRVGSLPHFGRGQNWLYILSLRSNRAGQMKIEHSGVPDVMLNNSHWLWSSVFQIAQWGLFLPCYCWGN